MKPSEYLNILNEIEIKYPVNEWAYKGVKIWPVIRLNLAMKLHQQSEKSTEKSQSIKTDNRPFFSTYIDPFLKGREYENPVVKKSDIVFLTHSLFKVNIKDKWYDRFVDPLVDQLNDLHKTAYTLEYSSKDEYQPHTYHPTTMIQWELNMIRLKAKLMNKLGTPKAEFRSFHDVNMHLKKFDVQMNSQLSYVKYLSLIIEMSKYFERILRKSEAKVGMVVYYYGTEGMAFNLACSRIGIPSVDLQHGVQGPYHRAYGSWSNVPDSGYELLPRHFWCWDEKDASSINSWADKTNYHKAFVGGNSWLELWKNKKADVPFIKEYQERSLQLIEEENKKKVVLVSLQTGRDIPSLLIELMNKGEKDWYWFIRLHPHMLKQKEGIVKKLTNDLDNTISYNIDEATNLPLYAILPYVDLHITEWSSVVIEAKEFGVKSLIVHEFGKELFKQEIDSEFAYYSNDANILQSKMRSFMSEEKVDNVSHLKSFDALRHYLESK
jgi:hypothetical protein